MFNLPGYSITEKIFESVNSLVYRGIRNDDQTAVILKVLKEDYPSREELIRYRQEYEITRSLNFNGSIQAHAQEKYGNSQVIVLEDFGGSSLKILLNEQKFTVQEGIKLGVKIAETLSEIHGADVIHKDINPSNIVYEPDSDCLKIIDFGISTRLSREIPEVRNPESLEGTLTYMSPEQTGRMNRALDYRTDYYALGATLFEILCGQPPFQSDDPMELVHAHLAQEPVSLRTLNPEVSENLSQIILKLLAKRAEDRYQSARGIILDLKSCLRESAESVDFVPGRYDVSQRFSLPQKLYGREAELEFLLNAAERSAKGPGEVLFISGFSGVGKSALVGELYKPIAMGRGYFISGKFDQFHRDIPYSAVQTAFRSLLQQLMTENAQQISTWKDNILRALGSNASVLTGFLPELKNIIGEIPPVPELDAQGDRNRFLLSLQNFVKVFCQTNHPLVLFLDDLQWADSTSLQFIETIVTGARHFFLVGAFRENEVPDHHPLRSTQAAIHKSGTPLNTLSLKPLGWNNVRNYVRDLTGTNAQTTDDLTQLILDKTGGNPFFMGELLKSLHRENIFQFDPDSGAWHWDSLHIQEQNISPNVVEFMSRRIGELDQEPRELLARAACLGNIFALGTLATIYEKSLGETAADLWPALDAGLILPLTIDFKIASLGDASIPNQERITYKFAHDRIEEAAYSVIPDGDKTSVHLNTGRLLLQAANQSERERKVFTIVDHLNLGSALMSEQLEKDELADLNLLAGNRARASAAYEPALRYFQAGLVLLGEDRWQRRYESSLELANSGAEAAFLGQNYDALDVLSEEVLEQAKGVLDKVRVYVVKIETLQANKEFGAAIQTGLAVLGEFGIRFPEKPGKLRVLFSLLWTQFRLTGKSPEFLENLPMTTDPHARASSRIMQRIASSAYKTSPNLLALLIFKRLRFSLSHGNSEASPLTYIGYGLIQCGILNNPEMGYRYGLLALKLSEHKNMEKIKARIHSIYYGLILHWKFSFHDSTQGLHNTIAMGLATGDLEYLAASITSTIDFKVISGAELFPLKEEALLYIKQVSEINQLYSLEHLNLQLQIILNLISKSSTSEENPHSLLIGEAYNEVRILPHHQQANNTIFLYALYFYKLLLSCIFREKWEAKENAIKAKKYIAFAASGPGIAPFHAYDSLAHLAVYRESSVHEQKRIQKLVHANQKKLKFWSKHAPMNNLHRYHLVAAEEARVMGRPNEARPHYETAIKLAHKYKYPHEEALSWELAAGFYEEQESEEFAKLCLKNAHYGYARWGAEAKVLWLEKRHPWLELSESPGPAIQTQTIRTTRTTKSNTASLTGKLDMTSIMKASRAIADESNSSGMMQKLMQVVLENTGARAGYLILEKNEKYLAEALARSDAQDVELLNSRPIEDVEELPSSLISYVIRSKEALVLEDAGEAGLFQDDPAVRKRGIRSVICVPIQHQQNLSGLLYLENNLASGAFSRERLEMLNLLSSQIAVSLKNVLNYEELLEANRTKSLFLNKMSHELRTPLNHIMGTAGTLHRDPSTGKHQREGLEQILESGNRLKSFIDNLLNLSRSKDSKLKTKVFQLNELLQMLAYVYEKRAREKHLRFFWQPTQSIPAETEGDREALEQVLTNILDNAVEYTNSGEVQFKTEYSNGILSCEIKDTGPGLSPEEASLIFAPFQEQEASPKKEDGSGLSGLGLAVSKKLMEKMNGTLELQSEPGKGSRVILRIPLQVHSFVSLQEAGRSLPENYRDTIVGPDLETATELFELAKKGDIVAIIVYTERLEKRDPELKLFCEEVRRLAEGFQERKLADFIKRYT